MTFPARNPAEKVLQKEQLPTFPVDFSGYIHLYNNKINIAHNVDCDNWHL